MNGRDSVIEFTVPSHTPVDRVVLVPGASPTSFSRDVRISISPISQQRKSRLGRAASADPGLRKLFARSSITGRSSPRRRRLDIFTPKRNSILRQSGQSRSKTGTTRRSRFPQCGWRCCKGAFALMSLKQLCTRSTTEIPCWWLLGMTMHRCLRCNPMQRRRTWDRREQILTIRIRPDSRPFTERHPALLWVALAIVILLLGAVAFRSAKVATKASS